MNVTVCHLAKAASGSGSDRSPSRVAWIDVAKGIGIILVVYGHVSGGLVDAGIQPADSPANAVSALIYTFHMPLFFFLSGVWLPRASAKPFRQFARERVGTIVYPYVLWSSLQFIANLAMARFTNGAPKPFGLLSIFYHPYAQFWFLYVLFIHLLLVTPLLRRRRGAAVALMLGVVAYFIYPLVESLPWRPAAQILRFLLYIAAGAAVGPWLVRSSLALFTRAQGSMIAAMLLIALTVGFWRSDSIGPVGLAVASLFGTIGVVAASWAITGTFVSRILEFLGKRSLEIYVAHVIAAAGTRIILARVGGIFEPTIHLVLDVGAGIAFPVVLWWLASRFGFGFLFALRRDTVATHRSEGRTPRDAMPA
jgi:fucose 4-O-acetylase-like acetyltransferase